MASPFDFEATLCASVEVFVGDKREKTLVNNRLRKVGTKNVWEDFCESLLDDVGTNEAENYALDAKNVKVCLSADKNFLDPVFPEYSDSINTAIDFNKNLKYLKFKINVPKSSMVSAATALLPSAFDVLMTDMQAPQTKLARKKDTEATRFTGLVLTN